MAPALHVLMASFDTEERRRLAEALARDDAPSCPACGGPLDLREVERPPAVAYVRRRVWALCARCRRSGAIDVRGGGRP